ncbi:hypothetical protein CRG98_025927 [Punica granatum]|uniref:RNase H type-1 domain-containing protein n=1 Tax=Punica granatum TaxID=22663 RepID=A0A2I0JDE8_PUNGR|nr:hypothetical protein CRG98_025927 [Punica granatum]
MVDYLCYKLLAAVVMEEQGVIRVGFQPSYLGMSDHLTDRSVFPGRLGFGGKGDRYHLQTLEAIPRQPKLVASSVMQMASGSWDLPKTLASLRSPWRSFGGDGPTTPWLQTLRGRILDLCSRDWEVRMQHTYQEGNSCADKLANMAVEYPPDTHIIHSVPNGVFRLLLGDIVWATMPHFIPVSL